MRQSSRQRKFSRFTGITGGLAALAISAAANQAFAQNAEQSTETSSTGEEVESVLVVGTRASLKSAIERKRSMGTIADSIVAEDIAQFPVAWQCTVTPPAVRADGCPGTEPNGACSQDGRVCSYGDCCVSEYTCQRGQWAITGSECPP